MKEHCRRRDKPAPSITKMHLFVLENPVLRAGSELVGSAGTIN
jgi:hypothetical protein